MDAFGVCPDCGDPVYPDAANRCDVARCVICGCTEARSCALHSSNPTHWVDLDRPLCSGCVDADTKELT